MENQKAAAPQAVAVLEQIQQQMRDMCVPHYDEFHRVSARHGFVKITIPQKRRAASGG